MTAVGEAGPPRGAWTDPRSGDRRLRGRTYAISFDRVWTAVRALAEGGMPRWRLLHLDDGQGRIEAESRTRALRLHDRVHVDVALDENGQTRVDLRVTAERRWLSLGRGKRMAGRFFRRLDARVGARRTEILDPTRSPSWRA